MSEELYPVVTVRKDRVASIQRKHPWIFSKGIISAPELSDGDLVTVCTKEGDFLGIGHFHFNSIAVRILSFESRLIDLDFWKERLALCFESRKIKGLPGDDTNAYRLVHGEGDNLSGLIIDVYNYVAVIQCHSVGMHRNIDKISAALKELSGGGLTIYDKSRASLPTEYGTKSTDGFLEGEVGEVLIKENGHSFIVDVVNGQKTGFFLDQRENRMLLGKYASGRDVLNLYSYTGGFSIYALANGAKSVHSVDASKTAVALLDKNVIENKTADKHKSTIADVKKVIQDIEKDSYDIIVVDPPAFAKSKFKTHNAVQAYKRINAMAISKVKSNGFIFTFSCSQIIDETLFYNTITAAALEANRDVRVLHFLSQSPDHPISLFHPEGRYLKGLVLEVR